MSFIDAPGGDGGAVGAESPALLRHENHYCSNCLGTMRFLDLGTRLVCERCSKFVERVQPAPPPRRSVTLTAGPDDAVRCAG